MLVDMTREQLQPLHCYFQNPVHSLRKKKSCCRVLHSPWPSRDPRRLSVDGRAEGVWLSLQKGGREHLAAKSLKAKRQLIHTNGIWTGVEGIREEPAGASRRPAPRSSLRQPPFTTQASPDVAADLLAQHLLPHQGQVETSLPAQHLRELCSGPWCKR